MSLFKRKPGWIDANNQPHRKREIKHTHVCPVKVGRGDEICGQSFDTLKELHAHKQSHS